MRSLAIFLFLLGFHFNAVAANEAMARQSLQGFLTDSLIDSTYPVEIKIGAVDLSNQPPCATFQGFLPDKMRLSGKTWVGLRCVSPQQWELLVPVRIAILGEYVIAAQNLQSKDILTTQHLTTQTGDLSALPMGYLTNPADAVGYSLTQGMRAGQIILKTHLRKPTLVQRGQMVKVVVLGDQFSVSSEGKAMNAAGEGESITVRMPSGQTISGNLNALGQVEIQLN